ncbi:unnamed protein product, partial [Hapterophycus canaliculatus]
QTFEQDVAKLGETPLHPALASAASSTATKASTAAGVSRSRQARALSATSTFSSSSLGSGGRSDAAPGSGSGEQQAAGFSSGSAGAAAAADRGEEEEEEEEAGGGGATLLDCIPVEREQRLLESCRTSQRRFQQEADNVAQKYSTIERGIQEQRGDPVTVNDAVQDLLERARLLCREQESNTAELEANYSESFNLAKANWTDDAKKPEAITRLTELIMASENIVKAMKDNDLKAMVTVVDIARAKAALSNNLRRRLREVSRLQTDIGKIQKHQELVGMAWGQKEEQFEHLGKVARMPAAYDAFLREVSRQRRFHQDFEAKALDFCRSMAALRSAEIASREAFLKTHLGNLPPVFIEV